MFGATLKYFNLFVLPNPKFSIPISELEPVYRIRRRAPEPDASLVSNNSLSESKGLGTPRKKSVNLSSPRVLDAKTRAKRRNTFCPTDADKAFLHSDSNEMPFPLFDSFDFQNSPDRTSEISRNPRTRVRIVAPSDSPSHSLANRKLTHDIAALYSSNGTQESRIARNINNPNRSGSSAKGKEKRISAPPILAVYRDQSQASKGAPQLNGTSELGSASSGIYALPRSQLISTPKFLPPTLAPPSQHQQRPLPQIPASSSAATRPFENDLSPIIEDIFTFADPLDINEESLVASTADSSGSSYGQLLGEMHVDYFSLSNFGGLEWGNDEGNRDADCSAQLSNQGFGDEQDPACMGGLLATVEQQNLIPELTLTAPTPDMGESDQFLSGSGPRPLLFEDDPMLRQQRNPETATLRNGTSGLEYPFLDLNSPDLDLALGPNQGYAGTSCGDNSELGPEKEGFVRRNALGIADKNSETKRPSSFGWSVLRVNDKAKENIRPDKKGGAWKRFSRILESVSPPNGRRDSVLGCPQPLSNLNDASCQPVSRLNSHSQRSDSTVPSKRGSGSPISTMPVCIHEEGEHAASRLFGLPSTGVGSKLPMNEARKSTKLEGEKEHQARRRSFGFNVKGFRNRRRYVEEDPE